MEESKLIFVLARFEGTVSLVQASLPFNVRPGDTFLRMPALTTEEWTIVRVFNYEENSQLQALHVLIGMNHLKNLFGFTLNLEECRKVTESA